MLYQNATALIGNTPLITLHQLMRLEGLSATLMGKVESHNPAGSIKDRAALYMIENAEKEGLLSPGGTVIEATSGNTGIGLAFVCAARGYKTVIVMPDSMSIERQKLLAAYGAQLVLTPGAKGMQGAVEKAEELQREIPGSFIPAQFENENNPRAHEETTGPELWKDTEGRLDIFVCGVGTGGTLTGCGRFLKKQNPNVKIIAVEPAASPLLTCGKAGSHGLQGIGANFIPKILDTSLIDEVVTVTEQEAYSAARLLRDCEGVFVGISSGAALSAAITVAKRPENAGKRIAVIFPDGGDRYLSTELFN
ncbi:MAG: cysteine synthase A [Ruminococcaceae bacterium]|nr:cysteine synthase A [Oscillospiraceae bacterium]